MLVLVEGGGLHRGAGAKNAHASHGRLLALAGLLGHLLGTTVDGAGLSCIIRVNKNWNIILWVKIRKNSIGSQRKTIYRNQLANIMLGKPGLRTRIRIILRAGSGSGSPLIKVKCWFQIRLRIKVNIYEFRACRGHRLKMEPWTKNLEINFFGSEDQWSQIGITLMMSRIRIKVKRLIRTQIRKVKR
jgi:hypothetical protein